LAQIVPQRAATELAENGEADFSWGLPSVGRFRINVYRQRGTLSAAVRLIPYRIPDLEQLGLPESVRGLAAKQRGIILVTGPAGSGKSTTLASLVDLINSQRSCHIITIEDPIEYLHSHKRSIVDQREVGSDTKSFSLALRAALRQDPDVILVGEMRDLETMATAITAAETGHLVLASLHTASAAASVERILDIFPSSQQQQIQLQLATTLEAIVALAVEVLLGTPAVRNLIREGKAYQLPMLMQTGGASGMQSMDSALRKLHEQGRVTSQTAILYATQPEEIKRLLAKGREE
jgi:twitching motility protein PilT